MLNPKNSKKVLHPGKLSSPTSQNIMHLLHKPILIARNWMGRRFSNKKDGFLSYQSSNQHPPQGTIGMDK
jgi:hypothetical protein